MLVYWGGVRANMVKCGEGAYNPMRKLALAILILPSLASLPYPRQSGSAEIGKAAIDVCGVKLRLGMTKGQVTDRLAGSEITKVNDDDWIVAASGKSGPLLRFRNGRLTFASRDWPTYDNDIGEALFGAVTALNQEGFSACTVTADIKADPTATLHRVLIACGEKSLLIVRANFSGSGKSYNTVDENLGTVR
jgi:hypothetical protein